MKRKREGEKKENFWQGLLEAVSGVGSRINPARGCPRDVSPLGSAAGRVFQKYPCLTDVPGKGYTTYY